MEKTFWATLKENWVVIVVIGQFIFTVYTLEKGFSDHENRLEQLEDTKVSDALVIAQINSRLASIETSLVFIKEAVR